jgi:CRP/FNR family cyclic AMP-dependent transcriptional regulator
MSMDLFAGLGDDEVRRFMAGATRRRFAKREVLFHEGDPAEAVHLIQKGRVAVRITTDLGVTSTLDVVGPGQVVGELALLPPAGRRAASAVALEAVETMVLSAAAFGELRASHPRVDDVLMGIMAARIRDLNARLSEALYVPVETRIARRLLGVAGHYAVDGDDAVVVPLTQDDLAGLAGTTRESVNRFLRRLESEGVLELRRGAVSLLDQDRLARLAR